MGEPKPSQDVRPGATRNPPTGSATASTGSMSVAVVILTFNEEENIGPAIESVLGWAQEVFVVDSFSVDRTVDIARGFAASDVRGVQGVQIVQHTFENYSAQWNWALDNLPIRADWILKLDADERVTPAFQAEVGALLARDSDGLEGMYFRRRLIFMGKALEWGGMASFDLRLWRRGCGHFDGREVNEHLVVHGRTVRLASHVEHHDTKSLSDWWDKHNRYSSFEALNLIERSPSGDVEPSLFGDPAAQRMWIRDRFFSHPFRFLASAALFFYHYVARLGFLDGTRGFQAAFLRASFFYMIQLKVLEYQRTGRIPTVIWPARGSAHPDLTAEDSPTSRKD